MLTNSGKDLLVSTILEKVVKFFYKYIITFNNIISRV